MITGSYSRWMMADLSDRGWYGKPSQRYIGVLWGSYGKGGTPKICVTSMAIAIPYTGTNGVRYNECSQFQNIFRLLNGDKLIEGQINFDLWIRDTIEIVKNNSLNFMVQFGKRDSGAIYVAAITCAENDTITKHSDFQWPDSYKTGNKTREAPNIRASRNLYKNNDWVIRDRVSIKLDTPIEVNIQEDAL
jgi:hypothetical protein